MEEVDETAGHEKAGHERSSSSFRDSQDGVGFPDELDRGSDPYVLDVGSGELSEENANNDAGFDELEEEVEEYDEDEEDEDEEGEEEEEEGEEDDTDYDSDGDCFPALYTAIVGPPNTIGEHGDNLDIVLRLLDEGADVNEQTPEGWTPLMVSGSTGQPTVMCALLARGADILARDQTGNGAEEWTLHTVRGHADDVVLTVRPGMAHNSCAEILKVAPRLEPRTPHHF